MERTSFLLCGYNNFYNLVTIKRLTSSVGKEKINVWVRAWVHGEVKKTGCPSVARKGARFGAKKEARFSTASPPLLILSHHDGLACQIFSSLRQPVGVQASEFVAAFYTALFVKHR